MPAQDITGDPDRRKAGQRGEEVVHRRIFALHRLWHILLCPGNARRLGNRATDGEKGDDHRHVEQGGLPTIVQLDPGRKEQEDGKKFADAKEGEVGPFVAEAGGPRGDEGGDQPQEGHERKEKAHLSFAQPQLGEEEREDRAKEGKLDKKGIADKGGNAPRHATQLFHRGWFRCHEKVLCDS